MPTYNAYSLIIDSELPLDEFVPEFSGEAALRVKLGKIDFTPPDTNKVICRPVSNDVVVLYFKGVATALIKGRDITLQPDPSADPVASKLFVLQQVLGVVLLREEYLVLHSAAARVDGGAVAFMGSSGQGKSTLTAAINAFGCPILSDDVLAIDFRDLTRPLALPGLRQLKLTEESRSLLASEIVSEQPIRDRTAKKLISVRGSAPAGPVPLRAIFILETAASVEFRRLDAARALIELIRHTYAAELLHHLGRSASHFKQCAALDEHLPIFALRRPRDLSLLSGVARQVLDHVRQLPPS